MNTQLRFEELDLIQLTMSGLGQLLPDVVSKNSSEKLKVVFSDSADNIENELNRLYGNISLPYCNVMMRSMRPNDDSSINWLAMSSLPIQIYQPDIDMVAQFRLRPVILTCEIRLAVSNVKDIYDVLSRWLKRSRVLYFAIIVKGLTLKINCNLSTDTTFPTAEGGDNGSVKKIDFTIEVMTYVGDVSYIPPVKIINVNTSIKTQGHLVDTRTVVRRRQIS